MTLTMLERPTSPALPAGLNRPTVEFGSLFTTDHYTMFLESKTRSRASSNTVRAYSSDLKMIHKWATAGHREAQAVELVVYDYLNAKGDKWAASTVDRKLNTFRAFLTWAGHPGILSDFKNDSEEAAKPVSRLADIDEAVAFAEAVRSNHNHDSYVAVLLCGTMGLRVGESTKLQSSNVDLTNCTVRLVGTKSNKNRTLPITPNRGVEEALEIAIASRAAESARGGRLLNVGYSTVREHITTQGKLWRPEGVVSHDLRRTFATALYRKTKDIVLVQRWLGHSDPSVTARYIGLDMDFMTEGVQGL